MSESEIAAASIERIPWEDPSAGGVAGLFRTIGMVLTQPTEAFRRVGNGSGVPRALVFGVAIAYASVLVSTMWNALTRTFVFRLASEFSPEIGRMLEESQTLPYTVVVLVTLLLAPFFILATLFVGAGVFHLLLLLFAGATRGFVDTLRVVCYANACQVFGMVPFCGGWIAALWGLVLLILGLSAVHRSGAGKAAAAVLIPVLGCCACGIALYATLFAAVMSMAR